MAFSLFLIIFIYYPIIVFYLFPNQQNINPSNTAFYIEIPKINIKTPIIPGVDPFNEKKYRQALEKGVAQAKGTALPGEKGTIFLFAHSSDLPWRITRYNIAFVRLPELKKGDLIIIVRNGKKYKYKVNDEKTVWPDQVNYLLNTKKTQLILQTCVPIGTSFQRLLVFAGPQ